MKSPPAIGSCDAVVQRLRQANQILVLTHHKVDGDAMGSTIGLARALRKLGKTVQVVISGPLEPNLGKAAGDGAFGRIEMEPVSEADAASFDTIVVVDTSSWTQLESVTAILKSGYDRIVVIDHHAKGDDIAAVRWVDSSAPAAAFLVMKVVEALGIAVDAPAHHDVAEMLFMGLATDTGWFRFDNARADAFEAAGRLLRSGVDRSRLYQTLEENHRPQRLALEARALSSLRYARAGQVALMTLTLADFAETGGGLEDLTGVVNLPLVVGSVRVSVLVAQSEPGQTKLSFRAKPATDAASDQDFDVNLLAQRFGGGGHKHASGARVPRPLETALVEVMDAVEGWR